MARPPLEVADLIRAAGTTFYRTQPEMVHLAAPEDPDRHRLLPHLRARRSHRRVLPLRASRHLLQLVPQPALSEVPVQRARPLAGGAPPGTAAGPLCPCGVHAARANWRRWPCRTRREIYGLLFRASAETLLTVARDPQTSGGGDRLLQRAAHLESETAAEPSLMMPGIIISFVFSEQTMLIVCTAPV